MSLIYNSLVFIRFTKDIREGADNHVKAIPHAFRPGDSRREDARIVCSQYCHAEAGASFLMAGIEQTHK